MLASDCAIADAVVPWGTTTIAQKSCVGAVPALLCAERDHLSPVSVDGNVTAARSMVIVLPAPIAVCSTITNCLSIGRRAARTIFGPTRRLLLIICRDGEDPRVVVVS